MTQISLVSSQLRPYTHADSWCKRAIRTLQVLLLFMFQLPAFKCGNLPGTGIDGRVGILTTESFLPEKYKAKNICKIEIRHNTESDAFESSVLNMFLTQTWEIIFVKTSPIITFFILRYNNMTLILWLAYNVVQMSGNPSFQGVARLVWKVNYLTSSKSRILFMWRILDLKS